MIYNIIIWFINSSYGNPFAEVALWQLYVYAHIQRILQRAVLHLSAWGRGVPVRPPISGFHLSAISIAAV